MTATEQIRLLISEAAEHHGFDVTVTKDAYPDYEVKALLDAYDAKLAAKDAEIANLHDLLDKISHEVYLGEELQREVFDAKYGEGAWEADRNESSPGSAE